MTEEVKGSREEELERIRQVEASSEYQQKLNILREKMAINLKWNCSGRSRISHSFKVCGDSDYGCIGICFSLPPI